MKPVSEYIQTLEVCSKEEDSPVNKILGEFWMKWKQIPCMAVVWSEIKIIEINLKMQIECLCSPTLFPILTFQKKRMKVPQQNDWFSIHLFNLPPIQH